jgi:uncharacterized protein (DUF4415 family)
VLRLVASSSSEEEANDDGRECPEENADVEEEDEDEVKEAKEENGEKLANGLLDEERRREAELEEEEEEDADEDVEVEVDEDVLELDDGGENNAGEEEATVVGEAEGEQAAAEDEALRGVGE